MKKGFNLKETLAAGFSAGKWKMQILKLKNDLSGLEKQKKQAVNDLGKFVWESKISDERYVDVYSKLLELDSKRNQTQTGLASLQNDLQAQTSIQTQIKTDFSARISEWEKKKSAVMTRLNQAKTAHKNAADRFSQAKKQQQRVQTEMENAQRKISQLNTSTAPDKDAQIAALNNSIATQLKYLTDNEALFPTMATDIERLDSEWPPIQREVQEHEQQIAKLQQEMRETLTPVEAKIKSLNEKIREGNQSLLSLADQMKPWIVKLGESANHARPQAPSLEKSYAQIDLIQNNINKTTSEINLHQARIDMTDRNTMRNFYLTLAAAFFSVACLIAAAIVLPTALSSAVKLASNANPPLQSTKTQVSNVGGNQNTPIVATQVSDNSVLPKPTYTAKVSLLNVQYLERLSEYPAFVDDTRQAQDGWQYVIVEYALQNVSDKNIMDGTVGAEVVQFFADKITSKEGNSYDSVTKDGVAWFTDSVLPPGYRMKAIVAFEVPKNQTGLTMLFSLDSGALSQNRIELDTEIQSTVKFPTDPENTENLLSIGDTWEVPSVFRMSFDKVTDTLPDGLLCDFSSADKVRYKKLYLQTTIENLSGDNLSMTPGGGLLQHGILFSDTGKLFLGIYPCRQLSGDSDIPPGKSVAYFALALPESTSRLRLLLLYGLDYERGNTTLLNLGEVNTTLKQEVLDNVAATENSTITFYVQNVLAGDAAAEKIQLLKKPHTKRLEDDSWQYVVFDLIIENSGNSVWTGQWINTPTNKMIDSGGYTRDLYFDLGDMLYSFREPFLGYGIAYLTPGVRYRYPVYATIPKEYQPEKVSLKLGFQVSGESYLEEVALDLKNPQNSLSLPFVSKTTEFPLVDNGVLEYTEPGKFTWKASDFKLCMEQNKPFDGLPLSGGRVKTTFNIELENLYKDGTILRGNTIHLLGLTDQGYTAPWFYDSLGVQPGDKKSQTVSYFFSTPFVQDIEQGNPGFERMWIIVMGTPKPTMIELTPDHIEKCGD